MSLLEIEGLNISIGKLPILKNVNLTLDAGEVRGLVGESGSGKSMTALSIMQLLPRGMAASGRITFNGIDILSATEDQMNALRGDDIGMVFQEPMTALNPVKTIGAQVSEGIRWHTGASRADAEERTRKILDRVGLPEAKFPMSRYPHQLSGGQRQRVVVAIATALKPKLLIADEPTTALDVVLQAQILDLLRELVHEDRSGLLLISHDLAVVTDMSDTITIMRYGEVVDEGETARVLVDQSHPYTRQLAQASMHVPELRSDPAAMRVNAARHAHDGAPLLLRVENVVKDYPGERTGVFTRAAPFRAVDNVSFDLKQGESVALVGRSGCGKSTLARAILALDPPTSGKVELDGVDIANMTDTELMPHRRKMQVVFQDPYGSFDPRHNVERLVSEPLHLMEKKPTDDERREMVRHALHEVGLPADAMDKYPHEFSGGQRQRLSIARALITRPKLIIADEPVSALDVSIRAQVLDLFAELNQRLGIGYVFITHDLTVARAITDRVMVMHEGRIFEEGKTADVLDNPKTEPAKALVAAAPDLRRAIRRRLGEQG